MSTRDFDIRPVPRGIQLLDPLVQFDTVRGSGPSVISHAHSDHVPERRGEPVLATRPTADLLRQRGHSGDIEILEYDVWRPFDRWRLKLLPAGHILGSAMVLVERDDGRRLLYTGDMKLRAGLTAEPAAFEAADELIIECTFGLPIFRFPTTAEIADGMAEFARSALEGGLIPVFTGYPLGKGQEIMAVLAAAGIPTMIDSSNMWEIAQIYRRYGIDFGDSRQISRSALGEPRAWVTTPGGASKILAARPEARICFVSGWALLESRRRAMRATHMAPLSDHADYGELFDAIAAAAPSRVWTVHGPASDLFARDVTRRTGIRAAALA